MMILRYPVTWTILLINVIVFSFFSWQQQTLMFSDSKDVLALFWAGANFNPFTLGDQPWRIVTSLFLHGNILHIAMNMIALVMIGRETEKDEGSINFLLIYFITGIVSGMASLVFNVFSFSVGASGAIFGLYGYNIVREVILQYRNRDALLSLLINFVIFAVINYLLAVFLIQGPMQMMLDTVAHLGGIVCGAVLAVLQVKFQRYRSLLFLLVLAAGFSALYFLPRNQLEYYRFFKALRATENHQNIIYSTRLTNEETADSLSALLAEWNSLKFQLDEVRPIPEDLRSDTVVIRRYILLRKQETLFQLLQIQKESYVYQDSIEIARSKLDSTGQLRFALDYEIHENRAPIREDDSVKQAPLQPATVFYDSNWQETNAYDADYYRIGQHDSMKLWQGKVRDYYADGRIQMKGAYLNSMNHGIFLYYTKDQHYESAGRYDHDDPVGKWEYYYPNGKLHREIVYADRSFVKNVYDTLGNPQVKDGNGKEISWHSNGQIEEEGNTVNGWRQGLWKGFYRNGKTFFEEVYNNNILVSGKAVDQLGNRYVYDQSSFFPFPLVGVKAYRTYLETNVRKKGELHSEGKVRVNFTVDVDGTLRDFVVSESLCSTCDAEAIRLIKEGPKWRPALERGFRKVAAKGFVDVKF